MPLRGVSDFYDEGNAMHHCVYSMEYFKKELSVILSARTDDGKRVETVEYDMVNNKVLQSRGKFNKLTEFHDSIIESVNNSMELRELCEKYKRVNYNN